MTNRECRRESYVLPLFVSLLAAIFILSACTTPEKAKAQHIARGQALLKEKKLQEAVLEFRSALQVDEKLADAHWGPANAVAAVTVPMLALVLTMTHVFDKIAQ